MSERTSLPAEALPPGFSLHSRMGDAARAIVEACRLATTSYCFDGQPYRLTEEHNRLVGYEEANVDRFLLKMELPYSFPPRDRGITYEIPGPSFLTREQQDTLRGKVGSNGPFWPVVHAALLLLFITRFTKHLRFAFPSRPHLESDRDFSEGLTVALVHRLWENVQLGRLLIQVWGDDLAIARDLTPFRCALGEFLSASHAIEQLAEVMLEHLWSAAWEAQSHDNSSALSRAGFFSVSGSIPDFLVDWWYAAMPTLRRFGRKLDDRWNLDEEVGMTGHWTVGNMQDAAALLYRRRAP